MLTLTSKEDGEKKHHFNMRVKKVIFQSLNILFQKVQISIQKIKVEIMLFIMQ